MEQLKNYPKRVIPLYKPEPPFQEIKNGYGFMGVILLDTQKNKIQCHICGGWFALFGSHLKNAHRINSRQYKEKFGLNMGTPLCVPSLSKKLSKVMRRNHRKYPIEMRSGNLKKAIKNSLKSPARRRASIQKRNMSGRCNVQIKERLREIALSNGGNISSRELKKKDYRLWKAIEYWFPSFNIAKKMAGIRRNSIKKRLEDKTLLRILRDYHRKFHRFPSQYILETKKGLPNASTYRRHFGSYENAKDLAEKLL